MAPASNSSSASLSGGVHASDTVLGLPVQPAFVLAIVLSVFLVLSCAGFSVFILRRRYASKQKGRRTLGPRTFLLPSFGDSPIGSEGPKPLILPFIASVRSSRGKASILSKFIRVGSWLDTSSTDNQMHSPRLETSIDEGTLVDGDLDVKPSPGFSGDWAVDHLCSFSAARAVQIAEDQTSTTSKTGVLAKAEGIPDENCSVDIEDLPPSVSPSAVPSVDETTNSNIPVIPAIVVDDCDLAGVSIPSAAYLAPSIHPEADYLQVPIPSWAAPMYGDDYEPFSEAIMPDITNISGDTFILAYPPQALRREIWGSSATSTCSGPIGLGISSVALFAEDIDGETTPGYILPVGTISAPPRSFF